MTLKEWFDRQQGLTQIQFADQLGIAQSSLNALLNGKATPSPETKRAIHSATKGSVTPNDMVLGAAA